MNAQRKPSAKSTATKTARAATMNAVESTRAATENVVNFSNKALKDMQSSLSSEAQKTQEKIYAMSRDSAETFAKSADSTSKAMYEMINICRDNMEACMESGNVTANVCKEFTQEITEYANQAAAEQMQLAQEIFACRTLNDVVELQNKVVRSSVENYFEQCNKLSSLMFQCVNDVCEPINERMSEATEQMSKLMTA